MRFDEPSPGPAALDARACPARHNLLNARAALAALELAGFDARAGGRGARELPRDAAPPAAQGHAATGAEIYDDYAHHPTEVAATLEALRELEPEPADRRLPAAPLLAHEGARRALRRRARRRRRGRRARRLRRPASSRSATLAGRQRPRRRPRGGRPRRRPAGAAGSAIADRASAALAPRLREGDLLVTIGAGDVFELAEALVDGDEPARRRRARLPARAADDRPRRRQRRAVRAARDRGELVELLGVGRGRGARGRGRRLGLEPAGRRRRRPRPRAEARRRARRARARRHPRHLRRRRAPAVGGGEDRRLGADRARVRDQHPRHRRRRRADERQRLRRRARAGARVGRRLHRRGRRAPRARTSSGSSTGARTCEPGEVVARASFALADADPAAVKATLAEMRGKRREAQPSGIKTFGSTFKNPDARARRRAAPPASCSRPPAAQGLAVGGARLSPKHANFVENTGDGDHRRRARGDGRGPPARPRALRGRARARGPGARRGRVAAGLGARAWAGEAGAAPRGGESSR